VTSLAAAVNVHRLENDYALYVVTSDGVDTVGVWGSNPHAPTIFIKLIRYFCPPFIAHGTVWQTFGRLSQIAFTQDFHSKKILADFKRRKSGLKDS
jgi:hypothetical protein